MRTTGVELPIMPLLQNSDGTNWHIDEMAAMLEETGARHKLINGRCNTI